MIGVGIIGANPDRGWALDAHIPAIAASPEFELRAVATSQAKTARAAAAKFSVNGYDSVSALSADPAVDLIVVSVKVPQHAALVRAALSSGKPIFCEWPLGNGLEETEALAREASAAGVRTFIGLQGRVSPSYRHVRQLVQDGYVGEILSTSILASSPLPGPFIDQIYAYTLDARNGATMSMIPFGHTIDAICWCLGELSEITAKIGSRRKSSVVAGTGQVIEVTVPDQLAVAGTLPGGAFLSAYYRGGLSAATGFLWEIVGSEGVIAVTAPHGTTEHAELKVFGARGSDPLAPLDTPPACRWAPQGTPAGKPYNVAQAYALIAEDLRDGGQRVPSFTDAAARHAMLAQIDPTLRMLSAAG